MTKSKRMDTAGWGATASRPEPDKPTDPSAQGREFHDEQKGGTTMTTPTESQRLAKLTQSALEDAEARAAKGEVPSVQELNGLRRLVERLEREREFEDLSARDRGTG
jgi:hypothetical protein